MDMTIFFGISETTLIEYHELETKNRVSHIFDEKCYFSHVERTIGRINIRYQYEENSTSHDKPA